MKRINLKNNEKTKRLLINFLSFCFRTPNLLTRQPRFTVVLYHSINPYYQSSVHPQEFEKQISFLTSNYSVVPLKDFFRFNKSSFAITFDDGYEDNFHYAFPILKKYNCPATFFITTGFITKELDITKNWPNFRGLTPFLIEQIKEMKEKGMDFGVHTHTHPVLSQISFEKAKEEIHKSKTILENILGEETNLFAYPFGQPKTFNKGVISILNEAGFQIGCSTIWGRNTKKTDPFILRRIPIDSKDDFERFKAKIRGEWDFMKWYQYFMGKYTIIDDKKN